MSWKDILIKEEAWEKRIREKEANDPAFRAKQEAKRKQDAERKKERDAHVKKHPFVKDYRFGRCQVSNGTRCVRPLQSPERRKYARSKPDGKTCMYCEDDTSKWSHVPEVVWKHKDWKGANDNQKKVMLDSWVKQNPKYDSKSFEPSYY